MHQHHERLNGSGYPLGLSGEDILLEARILGVADVVVCDGFVGNVTLKFGQGLALAIRNIVKDELRGLRGRDGGAQSDGALGGDVREREDAEAEEDAESEKGQDEPDREGSEEEAQAITSATGEIQHAPRMNSLSEPASRSRQAETDTLETYQSAPASFFR